MRNIHVPCYFMIACYFSCGKKGNGVSGDPHPVSVTSPDGVSAGNLQGQCTIPEEAKTEDVSSPRTVVGTGTPESCTGKAFVDAVAKGGVITFSCGLNPVTLVLSETAKIRNDTGPEIVIDGGGKITLSGAGKVRILYQNTCDPKQVWTSPTCQNQETPQLTLQNLTFIEGNSTGETYEGGGGGAVFVRGGRLKVIHSKFFNNRCDETGPDVGGGAIRVLSQWQNKSVYIVNSTFGGQAGLGNKCSNGGAFSSIGVSFTVLNSLLSHNQAIGNGANPARVGTPGGGNGGAIYNDGNTFNLNICGSKFEENSANEGGGAIFFVSNNRTGSIGIESSDFLANKSGKFETNGYPGLFVLAQGAPQIKNSTLK